MGRAPQRQAKRLSAAALKRLGRQKADAAVRFINGLTHAEGNQYAAQPFKLRKWQESIVRQIFGTLRPDGLRQYRTVLLMLPRKNGKTELAAAIALFGLMGDNEIGAQAYSAASDKDQASLVFNVAAQMIRNDPELSALCDIADSLKKIVYRPTHSTYKAISSEASSKHGYNCSMLVYDELHAAPNRNLWDVLTTSQGARTQPLNVIISTAGYDRHSIMWELYAYAKQVRDGLVKDPSFLPILYEAPADADWQDEAVWKACNPALGDFRSLDEMRTAARQAAAIPARQNSFRRLYLNQWTEQAERWLDMKTWDACAGTPAIEPGRLCFAGLDLATTQDITALVLVFPDDEGGYAVLPRFWIPEDGARQRAERDRAPYLDWIQAGFVTATPGNVTDYDAIRETIRELAEQYEIRQIAYDRWNASQLITQLQQDGAPCVPIGQGFASMTAPTKELEKLVLGRKLQHGGHPVLRWMAGNAAVEQDAAGNLKLSKKRSTERIDGMVALAMALSEAIRDEMDDGSVYDERGLDWVDV